MAQEEFTIRIDRKGRVTIECPGLDPQRLRDLAAYLQETLGPLRIAPGTPENPGPFVEIEDLAGRENIDEIVESIGEAIRLKDSL